MENEHPLLPAWRTAYQHGAAAQLCDRIIRERPVPDRLVAAIHNQRFSRVTVRQLDAIRLVSFGCRYNDVADKLGVSRHTVEATLARLYRNLGCSGYGAGTVAVARLIRAGAIE